jgi:hypothetical protein
MTNKNEDNKIDQGIIRMNLTEFEWNFLEELAKKKRSSSNVHSLIRSELYKFYEKHKDDIPDVNTSKNKLPKNFEIHNDIASFYYNLSKHFNVRPATIIFRAIVLPMLNQADAAPVRNLMESLKT